MPSSRRRSLARAAASAAVHSSRSSRGSTPRRASEIPGAYEHVDECAGASGALEFPAASGEPGRAGRLRRATRWRHANRASAVARHRAAGSSRGRLARTPSGRSNRNSWKPITCSTRRWAVHDGAGRRCRPRIRRERVGHARKPVARPAMPDYQLVRHPRPLDKGFLTDACNTIRTCAPRASAAACQPLRSVAARGGPDGIPHARSDRHPGEHAVPLNS